MSHVEKKLMKDFKDWRAETKRNGTINKTIKKDLEEFMETRFQIKPSQTEGEQPLTILDILDMMIAPDVDASVAANSVRHNAIACQTSEDEKGEDLESAYSCSDPRFTLSGTKCFHVSTAKETYANAVTACKDMGGELAKISSLADDEIVRALRQRSDVSGVFIGLNNNQGSWAWQDGSALTSYTNWLTWPEGTQLEGQQEPRGRGNCVLVYYDDAQNGGWTDQNCAKTKKYACSKTADDRTGCTYSCSDSRFTLLGDKCFYVSSATAPVNFADAATACRGMNAHLAKISSLGEDVLVSAMRSGSGETRNGQSWSPSEEKGGLWIGANDLENEGTWVWEDGSSDSPYSNWINQEPNDDDGAGAECGVK